MNAERERRRTRTHRADGLREPGHAHDHGEAPPTEGGDGELVVDVAELRRGGEDAEVVELGEELRLPLRADGVLRGEAGEAVRVLAQRAAEPVVSTGLRERRQVCDGGRGGRTCDSPPCPGRGTAA